MKQPQALPPIFTLENFAEIGMSAVLHNYQQAVDVLTAQMNIIRQFRINQAAALHDAAAAAAPALSARQWLESTELPEALRAVKALPAGKKRGAPKGASKDYWASMTAEERSAEMKRRMAVSNGTAASRPRRLRHEQEAPQPLPAVTLAPAPAKLHPRDARHPEHAAFMKKLAKAARNRWKNFTPEERAKESKRMSEISKLGNRRKYAQ